MSIVERLKDELTRLLKSGEKEKAGVMRLLLSELHNKEKEKFGGAGGVLSDEDATAVLQREAKKRKEAIELFKKGGRLDLVAKDEAELAIIGDYLPKPLYADEIKKVINASFEKGAKDFSSLMKETMKELKGKADGRVVGDLIKEKLGGAA